MQRRFKTNERKWVDILKENILNIICDGEKNEKHRVIWGGNDYPAWTLEPGLDLEANDFSEMYCSGIYKYTVIGNIYENPDLLEERK